ncbi:glycosyltransferase family 4 protein [Desertimonas flava]|uniref:glycosyltransferase family 4 protein n=1 Tax=Desertimonas flava TaxID=2064846 RepID=UPI000E3483F1|nr:glycosyltransferase family 4 protein [Desertimonas flava]
MTSVDVLLVSPPTPVWGAQLRMLDYAPALAERGVRLTLASPPDGDFHARWVGCGLPHRAVDLPMLDGIRDPETDRRPPPHQLAATLARAARGTGSLARAIGDVDAVWSFYLRSHPASVIAARLRRVPVVVEVVDIVSPGIGRRILQRCSASADATIVNSAATGAALEGRGRNVHIIHPGVDIERFEPGPTSLATRRVLADDGGVLFGIAGRIDEDKGIDVLIEAFARVPRELDARLAVIGAVGMSSEAAADRLRARAAELLGGRARFVGRRDDMPDVLRCLDVLVNASPAEPFGRSVLEAQATGVAVIGSRQGGIPEFVSDGSTGLLVQPSDADDLARAMTTLAADAGLRQRLGAAARAQAVADFNIVDRYDQVAELLIELVRP